MKKIAFLFLLVSAFVVNAQDLWTAELFTKRNDPPPPAKHPTSAADIRIEVRDQDEHPVKISQLTDAKRLGDFFEYYPHSWIDNYTSVVITRLTDGKAKTAKSPNDKLTSEQIALLKSAGINSIINITIYYSASNSVTGEQESRQIRRNFNLSPETKASYPGGDQALNAYLKKAALEKLNRDQLEVFKNAQIQFTIDKKGQVTNVHLFSSSGLLDTDQILQKAILDMKGWKPAIDINGKPVEQEMEFQASSVFFGGC